MTPEEQGEHSVHGARTIRRRICLTQWQKRGTARPGPCCPCPRCPEQRAWQCRACCAPRQRPAWRWARTRGRAPVSLPCWLCDGMEHAGRCYRPRSFLPAASKVASGGPVPCGHVVHRGRGISASVRPGIGRGCFYRGYWTCPLSLTPTILAGTGKHNTIIGLAENIDVLYHAPLPTSR
jgi:hypothetical protein